MQFGHLMLKYKSYGLGSSQFVWNSENFMKRSALAIEISKEY